MELTGVFFALVVVMAIGNGFAIWSLARQGAQSNESLRQMSGMAFAAVDSREKAFDKLARRVMARADNSLELDDLQARSELGLTSAPKPTRSVVTNPVMPELGMHDGGGIPPEMMDEVA